MEIINAEDKKIIQKTCEVLNNGGLIVYPTETSYAVGVDATNSAAVTKLLEYKKRPEGRAISVAVASKDQAEEFVEINSQAQNFYKNFMPGPVTIISNSKNKVDYRLEAENGTLGIRIPNYKLILNILSEFKKPVTATLASLPGAKTPYSIDDILSTLPNKQKDLIDLIIDGGQLPKNPPSTVIDTTASELTVLRTGRIDPLKTVLTNTLDSSSEQDTIEIGKRIIKDLYNSHSTLLILLNGELGAGKTHLTKGFALELGINQVIKSPTYNYVNEYKFENNKLFHMDAWKIQSKEDLNALGFYEWFKLGNVVVVEWPSVIMNLDDQFFENQQYLFIEFINYEQNNRTLKVYSYKP